MTQHELSPPPMASPAASRSRASALRDPRLWLGAYAVALAAIAFWPVPVDAGASGLLRAISRAVPWLTYDVIEFTANVLLFAPLGALLAMVLWQSRWLALLLALATTIVIECVQALFLELRTPSVRDVVANFVGAAIGILIVVLMERRRAR